jgi:hypothetical protein
VVGVNTENESRLVRRWRARWLVSIPVASPPVRMSVTEGLLHRNPSAPAKSATGQKRSCSRRPNNLDPCPQFLRFPTYLPARAFLVGVIDNGFLALKGVSIDPRAVRYVEPRGSRRRLRCDLAAPDGSRTRVRLGRGTFLGLASTAGRPLPRFRSSGRSNGSRSSAPLIRGPDHPQFWLFLPAISNRYGEGRALSP